MYCLTVYLVSPVVVKIQKVITRLAVCSNFNKYPSTLIYPLSGFTYMYVHISFSQSDGYITLLLT